MEFWHRLRPDFFPSNPRTSITRGGSGRFAANPRSRSSRSVPTRATPWTPGTRSSPHRGRRSWAWPMADLPREWRRRWDVAWECSLEISPRRRPWHLAGDDRHGMILFDFRVWFNDHMLKAEGCMVLRLFCPWLFLKKWGISLGVLVVLGFEELWIMVTRPQHGSNCGPENRQEVGRLVWGTRSPIRFEDE